MWFVCESLFVFARICVFVILLVSDDDVCVCVECVRLCLWLYGHLCEGLYMCVSMLDVVCV